MTQNAERCGNCGTENPEGTDFCRNCGQPMTASAEEGLWEHLEAQDEPEAVRDSSLGFGQFDPNLTRNDVEAGLPPKD